MHPEIKIEDVAIWFKHVKSPPLLERLRSLEPEQEITLETGGVVGRWQRMKTGSDGRETLAIRPVGSMKTVWGEWFKTRKGENIEIREVRMADDLLKATSGLFSEWSEEEDEEAFRDL